MSTKTLDIEVKTIHMNVTALARRAGLPADVAEGVALMRFTSFVVDAVMEANGAQRTVPPEAAGGGGEN